MLQKLLGRWPFLGVLGEGELEETVEILGPAGLVLQLGWLWKPLLDINVNTLMGCRWKRGG